ncbi:MAG: TetR/AcrR family transcriptional regulator [Phycisphaerae bacterium]|nr:TetR/AcrR family transcriptional regulator [Phycisphaerae bacterium]
MDIKEETGGLAQRRRLGILDSAKRIFAEQGYRRTKVEDISNDLSVGKGTLYRYFPDKKGLFLSVFEYGMEQLCAAIFSKVDSMESPPEKIKAAVRTYFEFFEDNPQFIEIMMQVRSEFRSEFRQIHLELYGKYIGRSQTNLRNGMANGQFREMNVEQTADVISALLQGVLQNFYLSEFETSNENGGMAKRADKRLTDYVEPVTCLVLEGLLRR